MKRVKKFSYLLLGGLLLMNYAQSSPQSDLQETRAFFFELFPTLQLSDYANGVYAIDPISRESWQAIMEFPPYEPALEEGERLYKQAFPNKHHYADCLPQEGVGITQYFPRWNKIQGKVETLEGLLNACRKKNQLPELNTQKGELAKIMAYLSFTSRGKAIQIDIPKDDPRALVAYEQGKAYYYRRQGQLNFSCYTCHTQNAGKQLRSEVLSPMLGHTAHWPVYRLAWGELGTLHRRFIDCLELLRIPLLPAQSKEFNHLEYFLAYNSNGVQLTGPSMRK